MAEVCAGVISSLGMSKAVANICLWTCCKFPTWVRETDCSWLRSCIPWSEVFGEPIGISSDEVWCDSLGQCHSSQKSLSFCFGSRMSALLCWAAGSGTRGTPLSLLSSSFSQFPFSAEFQGEHGSSRCWSGVVFFSLCHTGIFPLTLQIPKEH